MVSLRPDDRALSEPATAFGICATRPGQASHFRTPALKVRFMKCAVVILLFGIFGARGEVQAAQCSSYYISEINIVSVADADAGNVQTFVGFGQSKEESEKNAMGACSHLRFDLETCLDSDRTSGRNAFSDSADNSLHFKYMKAVKRVTGCE